MCNYWSLLVITTALVGCFGSGSRENGEKRREKKTTTKKTEDFYTLSEHWEFPFSLFQPELESFSSTSLFAPDIHSWFKLHLVQAEAYWRGIDGSVQLVQWYFKYFKSGVLL